MSRIATAPIVVPEHKRIEGFIRGVEFWNKDVEYKKIYKGFKSVYDIASTHRIRERVLPGLAEMREVLNNIEQYAIIAANDTEQYEKINMMLRRIDRDTIEPFVDFLRVHSDEAKQSSSRHQVLAIMNDIAMDRDHGSRITLARLDASTGMLYHHLIA
jgi:hypothetical protein